MKKQTILALMITASMLSASCGVVKNNTPEVPAEPPVTESAQSTRDAAKPAEEAVQPQDNKEKAVGEKEETATLTEEVSGDSISREDPAATSEDVPSDDAIDASSSAYSVDEYTNVTPTEDNNVLPQDIDPNEYRNEGEIVTRPQEAEGMIDFDDLQELTSEIASYAQGDAGSSIKGAMIAADAMEFANDSQLASLDHDILHAAILSVTDQMMEFEIDGIINNAPYIKSIGDAFFDGDESWMPAFTSSDAYETASEESQISGARDNWDALWHIFGA